MQIVGSNYQNSLLHQKISSTIPALYYNGKDASRDDEKAELLNDYFCSQSSVDDLGTTLPDLPISDFSLTDIEIKQDIRDATMTMGPPKANGPDKISPRLLRAGVSSLFYPLSKFFNSLLQKGEFP